MVLGARSPLSWGHLERSDHSVGVIWRDVTIQATPLWIEVWGSNCEELPE